MRKEGNDIFIEEDDPESILNDPNTETYEF